jgi:hypothetical protein
MGSNSPGARPHMAAFRNSNNGTTKKKSDHDDVMSEHVYSTSLILSLSVSLNTFFLIFLSTFIKTVLLLVVLLSRKDLSSLSIQRNINSF